MPATYSKPTKIPRWADDLLNVTEPSEGKKDEGWLFEEIPPSNYENWKEQINGSWWKWINERLFDGASADEFVIKDPSAGVQRAKFDSLTSTFTGTGVGNGIVSTGGATNGNGVRGIGIGTGAGIRGEGSTTAGSYGVIGIAAGTNNTGVRGEGTGTGAGVYGFSSSATGQGVQGVATATGRYGVIGDCNTGAGAGVLGRGNDAAAQCDGVQGVGAGTGRGGFFTGAGTGSGVRGEGGATDGNGVTGQGGGTNGRGGQFLGAGSGTAVLATAINGYGVVAESDTTSPTKSAFRMLPQNADPSSPLVGDVYMHTPTLRIRHYNGNAWEKALSQLAASSADSTAISGTTSETVFSTGTAVIPADVLAAGSTVRIRAWVQVTNWAAGTLTLRARINGLATQELTNGLYTETPNGSGNVIIEFTMTARAAGAAVAAVTHMSFDSEVTGTPTNGFSVFDGATINTTIQNTLSLTAQWSSNNASNSVKLVQWIADLG